MYASTPFGFAPRWQHACQRAVMEGDMSGG